MNELMTALQNKWKETGIWIAGHLLITMFPIILPLFIYKIFSLSFPLSHYADDGEFVILSSSLIAIASYHILKDYKNPAFPYRVSLGFISFGLIAFATVLLISINIKNLPGFLNFPEMFDTEFFLTSTYFLYGGSLVFAVITFALAADRLKLDIHKDKEESDDDLEEGLDDLGEDE